MKATQETFVGARKALLTQLELAGKALEASSQGAGRSLEEAAGRAGDTLEAMVQEPGERLGSALGSAAHRVERVGASLEETLSASEQRLNETLTAAADMTRRVGAQIEATGEQTLELTGSLQTANKHVEKLAATLDEASEHGSKLNAALSGAEQGLRDVFSDSAQHLEQRLQAAGRSVTDTLDGLTNGWKLRAEGMLEDLSATIRTSTSGFESSMGQLENTTSSLLRATEHIQNNLTSTEGALAATAASALAAGREIAENLDGAADQMRHLGDAVSAGGASMEKRLGRLAAVGESASEEAEGHLENLRKRSRALVEALPKTERGLVEALSKAGERLREVLGTFENSLTTIAAGAHEQVDGSVAETAEEVRAKTGHVEELLRGVETRLANLAGSVSGLEQAVRTADDGRRAELSREDGARGGAKSGGSVRSGWEGFLSWLRGMLRE
ncbi:MAG: hypothetical protein AAGD06_19405 [Acidobacteriota bacterium]